MWPFVWGIRNADYYNVSIVSNSFTAFLATATPNTNGGQSDDGTFAISQSGIVETEPSLISGW